MIRNATTADIPRIAELGKESLEINDPYPELILSEEKITEMARELVEQNRHFAWVSEINGVVVGAVCGYASENTFYERQQLSVVMYYCRVPQDGGRLLKKLYEWFESRPILKMCTFILERNVDPKLCRFLERLGFDRELPTYVKVK